MKQNYNFEFNPPEPSDEQIKSHMDFDALLQKVDQPPLEEKPQVAKQASLRRPAYIGTAIAATLVGVVFFTQFYNHSNNANYNSIANTYFEEQPFINPPFEQAQAQLVAHNMNADTGGEIKINNKTNINVPPTAFVDPSGNPVSGNINIKYRNLDDPSEYFMSGIPMYYDSLGTVYDFEATQLFEIYAEKDGQELSLHPDKGMEISFSGQEMAKQAKKTPSSLGVYQLDVNKKQWNYEGQSKSNFARTNQPLNRETAKQQIEATFQNEKQVLEQRLQAEILQLNSQHQDVMLPKKPIRYNPDQSVFDLDFNFDASNEYAKYKNLKWQPIGDENTLKMVSTIEWFEDEIELKEISKDLFQITFDNGEVNVELMALPVLPNSEYQIAIVEFEKKFAAANAKNVQLKQEKEAAISNLNEQHQLDLKAKEDARNLKLQALANANNTSNQIVERAVEHVFTINKLGIWNCDKITASKIKKSTVVCTDKNGVPFKETTLFVADMNRNSLTKYYLGEYAEINIDASSNNQIWLINAEGKLAVAFPNDLKKIPFSENKTEIKLNVIDQKITSEKDVYQILKLGSPM